MLWLLSLVLLGGGLALWMLVPALFIYWAYPWPVYLVMVGSVAVAIASRSYATIGVTALATIALLAYTTTSRLDRGHLAVQPGDRFPDFTLQTSTNESFSPSRLRGSQAALYIFYRGDW